MKHDKKKYNKIKQKSSHQGWTSQPKKGRKKKHRSHVNERLTHSYDQEPHKNT